MTSALAGTPAVVAYLQHMTEADLVLEVVNVDHELGVTCVRTNCGAVAAKRVALGALGLEEVFLSVVVECPGQEQRGRKRGEAEDVRIVHDYVYTKHAERGIELPDEVISWAHLKRSGVKLRLRRLEFCSKCSVNRECSWAKTGQCLPCTIETIGAAETVKRYESRQDNS